MLQSPVISLSDAGMLFDGFIDKLRVSGGMIDPLGLKVGTIKKTWFESALVKVEQGVKQKLSSAKRGDIQHF